MDIPRLNLPNASNFIALPIGFASFSNVYIDVHIVLPNIFCVHVCVS